MDVPAVRIMIPPGRGAAQCSGTTRAGRPCLDWVVLGFDHCLHHVPPDQLEAAEAVCGFRLCRRPGCLQYAIRYSDPPTCKTHCSGFMRRVEYRRHIMRLVEERRVELMTAWFRYQDGDRSPEVLHLLDLDA